MANVINVRNVARTAAALWFDLFMLASLDYMRVASISCISHIAGECNTDFDTIEFLMGRHRVETAGQVLWVCRLLSACVGVFVAVCLAAAHWQGADLPCGSSLGCEAVELSPAAFFLGVPTACFGALSFVLIAAATVFEGGADRASSRITVTAGYWLSAVSSVISLLLTGYSTLVLRAVCIWCITSATAYCVCFLCYALRGAYTDDRLTVPTVGIYGRLLGLTGIAVSVGAALTRAAVLPLKAPPHLAAKVNAAKLSQLWPQDAPYLGNPHASTVLIYFGDLQCGTCKKALPLLARAVQKTDSVVLVYRHFPRPSHAFAVEAAVASEEAKATVGFWRFVWHLYGPDAGFNVDYFHDTEKWALVDSESEQLPRISRKHAEDAVQRDLEFGRTLGFDTTPTLVVIQSNYRAVMSFKATLAFLRRLQ